jgi:hypothetical protein
MLSKRERNRWPYFAFNRPEEVEIQGIFGCCDAVARGQISSTDSISAACSVAIQDIRAACMAPGNQQYEISVDEMAKGCSTESKYGHPGCRLRGNEIISSAGQKLHGSGCNFRCMLRPSRCRDTRGHVGPCVLRSVACDIWFQGTAVKTGTRNPDAKAKRICSRPVNTQVRQQS